MTHAVSTWSLHRTLGRFAADHRAPDGAGGPPPQERTGGVALTELPRLLADHGFDTVQICHFHLESRDRARLSELRAALDDAGITLDALLVDAGDLVHPVAADAHEAWIGGWLDDAVALGARRARVIAGQQPPTVERLQQSADRLARLAHDHPGVRVVTENWLDLLPGPDEVTTLLDRAGDGVGLLVDLGNWTGTDKYDQLATVGGRAETCHAKCHTGPDGRLDVDDYTASLTAIHDAGFDGPLALVYDGPDDDEWSQLAAEQRVVDDLRARPRSSTS